MQSAEKYGFVLPENTLYQPIKTKKIAVDYNIDNLYQFAKDQGINYKILKLHNPWLRNTELKVTEGKTYYIEIPTEGY